MRSVKSIDVDLFEGADYQANLNFAGSFSDELGREFDLLYDGGTLEHVFHLPNALANIHKVVKPGGHIIHFNPMNNDPDHGFYQFSPTFYHDYYQANDFKIVRMFIFRIAGNALHDPYMVMHMSLGRSTQRQPKSSEMGLCTTMVSLYKSLRTQPRIAYQSKAFSVAISRFTFGMILPVHSVGFGR